uniref:MLX interacting protein n=1 Tax=Cynoglossus semilaevis TaxID=244447 RepID=A0A3P8W2K4_CYNSE
MSLQQTYRRPSTITKPDDDSDTEECNVGLRKADAWESRIIHSGHFMVSSPHCELPPKKNYDFDTVNKQTCQTYHFGKASTSQFSIDASLIKLFECMTLAYSGELVSPKWKNFKGLKLLWRDKIRLNNAIWRAWYMQYVERRKNPVCHFVTPLDGNTDLDVHRPEGIVTEEKCWKRRIEIVIREYHKWRTYFKKRLHKHKDDDLSSLLKGKQEQLLLFGEVSPDMLHVSFNQDDDTALRWVPRKYAETPTPMEMDNLFDMDVLMSEFSDTLFSTLASHQPMAWPNPREIAHAGNADMIQPGLISLQPNLDLMDSFDPLQDLFHSLRQPVFPFVSLSASSVTPLSSSSSQSQLMSSMHLTTNHISPSGPLPLLPPIVGQTTQTVGGGGEGGSGGADHDAYVQNYMPMFPGQVVHGDPPQQMSHDHLVQCLPDQDMIAAAPMVPSSLDNTSVLDEAVAPSVITHTASSVVMHSDVASTICQGSEYNSMSTQPPPSQHQLQTPLHSAPVQQSFALPHPLQIAPAYPLPPSQNLINPLSQIRSLVLPIGKVPISPPPLVRVHSPSRVYLSFKTITFCQQVVSFFFACPASNQPPPGSGVSCVLDQIPSSQSLISSSTALVKSEQNQSRRTKHISAEQKRRSNINTGFETLCSLVPTLRSQSNISNAATLQKTVEHIGKLQQERKQMQEVVRRLREENNSIGFCQKQLPATGIPVRMNHLSQTQEQFNEYVKNRTLQNWKFWIFSIIFKPLFDSFNGMVSTTSREELYQTTLQWLDRHCFLPVLRPMVLNTLCQLGTTTAILSDPSLLPEEAVHAVSQGDM